MTLEWTKPPQSTQQCAQRLGFDYTRVSEANKETKVNQTFINAWFDSFTWDDSQNMEYACWLGCPMTDYRGNFN